MLKNKAPNKGVLAFRRFFGSKLFAALQLLLAALITTLDFEVEGAIIFTLLLSAIFLACDDITVTTLPFMLVSMTLIKCFDSFDTFIWLLPLGIPAVLGYIYFFVHTFKWRKPGATFSGVAAVAFAVTLGGFGLIESKAYFSLTSIYYTFGLGIGMMLIYLAINNCCDNDENNSLGEKFARVMALVTLFGSFMVIEYYLENIQLVLMEDGIIPFQWRNNVSTFLMFGLPFPFYLSRKTWAWSFIGWLGYAAILLGGSRGGMIFGTIEMGMCVLLILWQDKKHRIHNLVLLAALAALLMAVGKQLIEFCSYTFERIVDFKENKTRLGLFERATEDFNANPLFGRGLAYWGNRDLHPSKRFALCWYHSAPFQIIGSFGAVGVLCYGWRLLVRLKTILCRLNFFTLTMAISFAGITMMSLVNPGEFCPLPYELITTMIFVILEKTPDLHKQKKEKLLAAAN